MDEPHRSETSVAVSDRVARRARIALRSPFTRAAVLLASTAAASSAFAQTPAAAPRPASQPASLVLEGFEKINTVRSWPEKLEAVTEGEGVTEGRQAARAPGGQNVLVKIRADDYRRFAWLKFDVLTLQPLSHPFYLVAAAPNWSMGAAAYAQAGKDTIAFPLSRFFQTASPEEVEFRIQNTSDRAVILDNIRLEAAAPVPHGCLAIDFGWDWLPLWPGFTRSGQNCPQIVWSGKVGIGTWESPVPDLLTRDCVGPSVGSRTVDAFDLVAPERNCTAWLWITHYAEGHVQAPEYILSYQGRTIAQKRIPRSQLLTADWLMEGMNGEWTPKWYDAVYAPRFVELVKLQLADVRSTVTVGNCQIAAMAMAPASGKAAMTTYLAQVQADLSRYHRQFVVGVKEDPRCDLNPSEADANAGLILLAPPAEDLFRPEWKPRESDRATKLTVLAANGLPTAVPFAFSPLKKAAAVTGSVVSLRSADGKTLAMEKDSPELLFCKTVPRVVDARATQYPWILTRKLPAVGDKQLAWALLRIVPSADAKPGLYQGAIRLNLGGSVAQIPVEVQVAAIGPETKDVPTLGLFSSGWPGSFYNPVALEELSDAARDTMQQKVVQDLLESANALCLPGPWVNGNLTIGDGGMPKHLRMVPAKTVRGFTLFDCQQALDAIKGANIPPGSKQYEQVASQLVARAATLTAGAGLRDYHIVLGTSWDTNWIPDRVRLASAIQAAGGSACLLLEDAYLSRTPQDQVQAALGAAGAVLFANQQRNFSRWVESYRKLKPSGRVYLVCDRPDRFAAGFYAAAVGADGVYFHGANMRGGTYNGFFIDGAGLVALDADGYLAPTAAQLWLQQGEADFQLVRRAEAIARAAADAKTSVPELTKALADLKAFAGGRSIANYDTSALRTVAASRTEIESLRQKLIQACAKAWEALHP